MTTYRKVTGYGWIPQAPDHRDRYYHLENEILTPAQLAPTGGLSNDQLPPIWNQLLEGSCTAHGALRAFIAECMRQGIKVPMLSRQFQYGMTRTMEGTFGQDSGAQVRDAIKNLATVGAVPESEWPYQSPDDGGQGGNMFTPIPDRLIAQAKKHLAISYKQIIVGGPGAPMRTALSKGLVIVKGFPVPDYFEDPSVWDPASEEPLPLPGPNTQYIGGHCTATVRYNYSGKFISTPSTHRRVKPYFTDDNSWDTTWGMGGRFNIDAEWFTPGRQLASDLWVLQAVT